MRFSKYVNKLKGYWAKFWMYFANLSPFGQAATRFASLFTPPYKGRKYLAHLTSKSFVSFKASIYHSDLKIENNVFIGDGVTIFEAGGGGSVRIGKGVSIHRDCIIETGQGGRLQIDDDTHIQPRCQLSAYIGSIKIGSGVQIAPNCAFYPYDHSFSTGASIKSQPLKSQGGIVICDDAWLGVGAIVLDGSKIGKGAVIGAGSVVNSTIPDNAIAVGNPARVIRYREEGD